MEDEFLNPEPGQNNLKKIREHRLLTQDKLSELTKADGDIGVSKVTISQLENDHHQASGLTRVRLANALGVHPDVLFRELTVQEKLKRKGGEITTLSDMKRKESEV